MGRCLECGQQQTMNLQLTCSRSQSLMVELQSLHNVDNDALNWLETKVTTLHRGFYVYATYKFTPTLTFALAK